MNHHSVVPTAEHHFEKWPQRQQVAASDLTDPGIEAVADAILRLNPAG